MLPDPGPVGGLSWRLAEEHVEPGRAVVHVSGLAAGEQVAEAHLSLVRTATQLQASLDAEVSAAFRRRGIGSEIVRWAEAAATQHFADALAAGEPVTLRVDIGSPADEDLVRFLAKHGLLLAVAEDEMRRPTDPAPPEMLPDGVLLEPWNDATAPGFFAVYQRAFRARPGFPGWDEPTWRAHFTGSDDFRPDLSVLVSERGEPVAYAVCWVEADEGWVVQMGVVPGARGRGIGGGLLAHVIRRFKDEGLEECALEVATNNPEARRVYERLGFVPTLRYESYRKTLR